MYADRVESGTRTSIRDRLVGQTSNYSAPPTRISSKRQRQDDDKWEHDLYDNDEPQISKRRVGTGDLRLKLQRKSIQQSSRSGKGSLPGGKRDLREKLSGTMYSHPLDTAPPKPKPVFEAPARKSVIVESIAPETKRVASSVSKKKTQQKTESVESFLQSLGLEKYSITFQAEEVDMTALLHMTDEDLKAVGIPMGPRRKILLTLKSRV